MSDSLSKRFCLGLLARLWICDAAFVLFYIILGGLVVLGVLPAIPDIFSLGRDWSIPETFNYAKWAAVIVLLVAAAAHKRLAWPALLAVAFTIILADDALQFHEHQTAAINAIWPAVGEGSPLAEMLMFGFLGIFVTIAVASAWVLASPTDRPRVRGIIELLVVIAFFAVVIDYIHNTLDLGLLGFGIWVAIEDGAELFLTSAILAYVVQSVWVPLRARTIDTAQAPRANSNRS